MSSRTERLSAGELRAWKGFLRAHARILRELEEELVSAHGLPLTSYDVLTQLDHAGGRLRMRDLAEAALLSRSGLTRLVDRLEGQGLVAREPCGDDARGWLAVLTDEGAAALAAARPTHLAGVRRRFLAPLGRERARALEGAWTALDEQEGLDR